MTIIYVVFTLAFAVALFFRSIPYIFKNEKKEKQNLCLRLSEEGTANNLVFCSQEIFHNMVIGFDGIHRKIMMLEKSENKYNCSVISLDEVQNCELITSCIDYQKEDRNKSQAKDDLQAIELHFEFKNHAQPASIIFYDSLRNSKRELLLLKAKAEYWSEMFSKMLTRQVRVRA
ncbi:MAG: hypothetical protein M3139_09140 [Bacteroidota bacterium]|nr:hypothetical protein [Bacteroidota bacterium]